MVDYKVYAEILHSTGKPKMDYLAIQNNHMSSSRRAILWVPISESLTNFTSSMNPLDGKQIKAVLTYKKPCLSCFQYGKLGHEHNMCTDREKGSQKKNALRGMKGIPFSPWKYPKEYTKPTFKDHLGSTPPWVNTKKPTC